LRTLVAGTGRIHWAIPICKEKQSRFPQVFPFQKPGTTAGHLHHRNPKQFPIHSCRSVFVRTAGTKSGPGSLANFPAPGAKMISVPGRERDRPAITGHPICLVMPGSGHDCSQYWVIPDPVFVRSGTSDEVSDVVTGSFTGSLLQYRACSDKTEKQTDQTAQMKFIKTLHDAAPVENSSITKYNSNPTFFQNFKTFQLRYSQQW
jgi:hypothetical protein